MLANVLIFLFFVLMDAFLIVAILAFINLCIISWIYEQDVIEYEEDDLDRK